MKSEMVALEHDKKTRFVKMSFVLVPEQKNAFILKVLRNATDALVDIATEAECCKWSDNPDYEKLVRLLDECAEELRNLEAELTK
jgi:uncharacterized protein YabN with tetrapyrrole methylase and pyrophosphatase domain